MAKTQTATFRLTDVGKGLLQALAEHRGISQAAIVETLVRQEAERAGVKPAPSTRSGSTRSGHGDLLAPSPHFVDGEPATEVAFYDGMDEEQIKSIQAAFATAQEYKGREEPGLIPGDVARARHRQQLADLRARPA